MILFEKDPQQEYRYLVECPKCGEKRSVSKITAVNYSYKDVPLCRKCTGAKKAKIFRKNIENSDHCIILEQYFCKKGKLWYALVQCPLCGLIFDKSRGHIGTSRKTLCYKCAHLPENMELGRDYCSGNNDGCIVIDYAYKVIKQPRGGERYVCLVKCPNCDVEFEKQRYFVNKDCHTYCRKCSMARMRKPLPESDNIIVIKEVSRYNNQSPYAMVECPCCGKQFEKTRNYIREYKHTICFSCLVGKRWFSSESLYYGSEWNFLSATVRDRDNYKCQYSGCLVRKNDLPVSLHVHHIVPFRLSYDNSMYNLISLCPSHHCWSDWHLNLSIPMFDGIIQLMYGPDYK